MEELEAHGATEIGVDWSHPHPRVCFRWRGAKMFYVTSASPSDGVRGRENALTSLRRMLGVKRIIKKAAVVRERKRRMERPAALPDTFTVAPDPWTQLRRDEHG